MDEEEEEEEEGQEAQLINPLHGPRMKYFIRGTKLLRGCHHKLAPPSEGVDEEAAGMVDLATDPEPPTDTSTTTLAMIYWKIIY